MAHPSSAIIYRNQANTLFIIDTPYSIALSQQLTTSTSQGAERSRILVSCLPREQPYPNTEPKTESARSRILARSSLSEQRFHHDFIQPLVQTSLDAIRADYEGDGSHPWCFSRHVPVDDDSLQKDRSKKRKATYYEDHESNTDMSAKQPLILSSTSNTFNSETDLKGIVKNTLSECTSIKLASPSKTGTSEYLIPPLSTSLLCTLPLSEPRHGELPIPGLSVGQRFNLILFDPPWPNRSVRRSRDYQTSLYYDMDSLTQRLHDVLQHHAYDINATEPELTPAPAHGTPSKKSIAAIWITNSEKARKAAYTALLSSGFSISEEWIWIKVTAQGDPVSPVNGAWKKPYEILVIGQKVAGEENGQDTRSEAGSSENDLLSIDPKSITRRVVAGVPDLHSRKPSMRCLFEQILFAEETKSEPNPVDLTPSYSALEVFARNLTAGWVSCGNEALKFNARDCWVEDEHELPTWLPRTRVISEKTNRDKEAGVDHESASQS